MITKALRLAGWLVVSTVAVAVFASADNTSALSNILPDHTSDPIPEVYSTSNGPKDVYLGIGHATSFDGNELEFAAYYDTYDSDELITLVGNTEDIDSGYQCRAMLSAGAVSPSTDFVLVTISTEADSVTYRVRQSRVCDGYGHTNSRSNPNQAYLFGSYQIPLLGGTPDSETGKYIVRVHVRYSPQVLGVTPVASGFRSTIFFRAQVSSGALVGTLGGSSKGIGTRIYSSDREYYSHQVEFGAPCSMDSVESRKIVIRDPDNYDSSGALTGTQGGYDRAGTSPRTFRFYVLETIDGETNRLTIGRYTDATNIDFVGTGGNVSAVPNALQDANELSGDSEVTIDMQPDAKYTLVADRVYKWNFLQINVPTDAIYNAIECDSETTVEPLVSIEHNPAVLGEDFTTSARIRNNGLHEGSTGYIYRAWYDTSSNRLFNPGDVLVGPPQTDTVSVDAESTVTITPAINGVVDRPDMAEICVQLMLVDPDDSTTASPTEATDCVPIGKYPQVQISGGDVVARGLGSEVGTVSHSIDGRIYGSWVEYSVFAGGDVSTVSGATLPASGYGLSTFDNRQTLIFANTTTDWGNFGLIPGGGLSRTSGVWAGWSDHLISPTGSVALGGLDAGAINYRNGNITIDGSSWEGVDDAYVVHARGANRNVTIANDIVYQSQNINSLVALPQLIIIADGNIVINSDVDRVDAWLIAGGTISTCGAPAPSASNYYDGLSKGHACDNLSLRINGPVQAGSLQLRRTHGAEGASPAQRSEPAEVLNLRSDAYLWAYGQASQSQSIRTDNIRELPPRF